MSFIATAVGGLGAAALGASTAGIIAGAGIGATIGGAKMASDGAKSAAKTAAAGGDRSIAFQEESRDLARADQAPYREAGYEALDALKSLVGIGGPQGGRSGPSAPIGAPLPNQRIADEGFNQGRRAQNRYSSYNRSRDEPQIHVRALGGPMNGGTIYDINEEGPENVYQGGKVMRYPGPRTISGEGYVQPNVEGRVAGGFTEDMGVGGPYGGLPYRPPATPIQPPPGGSGIIGGDLGGGRTSGSGGPLGPTPTGNAAGSTAINPQTGFPNENPGGVEGGYQFQTDPGYQFRFEEGQRALDRGAASRGGLLSGGYARKAIRYGQGFASNEFGNVYNRISNIAGLGQVSAGQSGQYAMYAGQAMGQAAQNSAYSQASGQQAAGNAWANAGNQIAQLPWGQVFKQTDVPGGGYGGGQGTNSWGGN